MEEARLTCLDWDADEVLHLQDEMELNRLEKVLDLLVPEEQDGDR